VGRISDAHGLKGELKIKLFSHETSWHPDLKIVYISGETFEVERLKPNKTFWILKLKGISDRTAAESYKGKSLEASEELFITGDDEDPYLSELLDFQVHLNGKAVGQVVSFQETQAHFLLVIKNKNGFFEIPYVDAFIESIDRESQVLNMSFPEDLLADEFKLKDRS
jgi:16S rRNA processing protein RimM